MEDTVFSKIIRRELPAEILYEDDIVIVILNKFPTIEGETLVITKAPVSYIFELDDDTYAYLMSMAKKMAQVLDRTFNTLRTCVVIEGFDVPHVHVRLYPLTTGRLDVAQGPEASNESLRAVGEKIRSNL